MFTKVIFSLLLLVLSAGRVFAQGTQVTTGSNAKLAWDASPDVVTGYKCGQNNIETAVVDSNARQCPLSTQVAGAHTAYVLAFNSDGESSRVTLSFTVANPQPPNPCPTPLTLTINRSNGWPGSATGSQLRWTTNRPATILFSPFTTPWSVTAMDANGCTATVTR